MIQLTRLNGNVIVVNSELIKFVEAAPDTMLTLVNGEKLIIREGLDDVMDRVLQYRARLLAHVALQLPERVAAAACIVPSQYGALERYPESEEKKTC